MPPKRKCVSVVAPTASPIVDISELPPTDGSSMERDVSVVTTTALSDPATLAQARKGTSPRQTRSESKKPVHLSDSNSIMVVDSEKTSQSEKRRISTRKRVVPERYTQAQEEVEEAKALVDNGEDSPLTQLESDDEPKPVKKRQRRKKELEPVVYDIPEVERKETAFTGRLGYACLNTLLRARKPESVFCSRTCRLETIRKNGIEFAMDLGLKNARDLCEIIEWNEVNRIRFFRVSSEMFPFASHKLYGYDLAYARVELQAAGALAKKYRHRLTTHPGQFTQLASPKADVLEASLRELDYHCQMLRYMGLDKDSVIIIHMGGVYGDKETTLQRFRENYRMRLTDEMKARVVLENDEICYSADDLLPICDELQIPMVLDYHHNWINPSKHSLQELLPLVARTWTSKGIRQKQHLSEPRPGAETVMEKRAHANRCKELPDVLVGGDVDLMIEAKDKEQAVFQLYRIYELEDVIQENLRPEKPPKPFIRGKGRVADGLGDVNEGEDSEGQVDDEGITPKFLERAQERARSQEDQAALEENTPAGPVTPRPTSMSPAKRLPKRRRTATNVVATVTTDIRAARVSPTLVPSALPSDEVDTVVAQSRPREKPSQFPTKLKSKSGLIQRRTRRKVQDTSD
ncbi:uncharacterized protein FIBRA_01401 [Fibroporia radiculosa]|uniref:UV-endonuclease UvdE n=1 Tax=Fibroporia radiculosa TaxID=599839 RepID=J4G0Y9_9APHY|nr:uncharacterized protein FIBRA_01401 [Fibroporia radiculosa]CCL99383.1 predicted protein [Fibroporia radiculosa]